MSYPTIVYKCPGDHQMPGGTYSYLGVKDEDAMKEAVKEGWFKTLEEAASGKPAKKEEEKAEDVAEDSAPTREELEQQAEELGIKYDGRTSDAKLLKSINDKLGA